MPEVAFDAVAAEALLARAVGTPVRRFFTWEYGRRKDSCGLSAVVADAKGGREIVDALQLVVPPGTVAFVGTTHSHAPGAPQGAEVVLAPGTGQFDILRLARTDACNYGMDTAAVIARLEQFNRTCGIRIWQAESDTVQFHVLRETVDFSVLAQDLYRFCPDIVDQGCRTVDNLEQILRTHRRVLLWWD